jgi:hypothetical protein
LPSRNKDEAVHLARKQMIDFVRLQARILIRITNDHVIPEHSEGACNRFATSAKGEFIRSGTMSPTMNVRPAARLQATQSSW